MWYLFGPAVILAIVAGNIVGFRVWAKRIRESRSIVGR